MNEFILNERNQTKDVIPFTESVKIGRVHLCCCKSGACSSGYWWVAGGEHRYWIVELFCVLLLSLSAGYVGPLKLIGHVPIF